jgi:hypothetical protein
MNSTLTFFIILFLMLAFFQLILLLVLTSKKLKRDKKDQDEQNIYKEAMPAFINYLYNEKDDYIPLPPDEYHVAEQLFSSSMAITKDEDLQHKIRESASFYLSSHYEKVMNAADWSARVNALYYIEDFRMTSLQPVLAKRLMTVKEQDEEKQQLLRTLAALGDLSVLSHLENEPSTKESVYLSVFKRFPEDVIPQTVSYVRQEGSLKANISLLMYLGLTKKLSYLSFVEENLAHQNSEMRIQALKALFQMNYISNVNLIQPFFYSEVWEERMFAAKITGVLTLTQFEKELTEFLGDSVWWVRYYAAEALLLSFGENKLLELSQSHPDQYARNMAAQWLRLERQVSVAHD